MYTMVASPNKIISWKKNFCRCGQITLYPPNYTKNRKIRDLLGTPDSKDEILQFSYLIQLINIEKSEWNSKMEKNILLYSVTTHIIKWKKGGHVCWRVA